MTIRLRLRRRRRRRRLLLLGVYTVVSFCIILSMRTTATMNTCIATSSFATFTFAM